MKVCVISDTHGHINSVLNYLEEKWPVFDEVWHLGDYAKDAAQLKKHLLCPIRFVKGNCDFYSAAPEQDLIVILGWRILLTHGHLFGVKGQLMNLYYYAEQEKIDLVCFGHTHEPVSAKEDKIQFFNPGSPSSPRSGYRPSIGIIEISEKSISCSHEFV